MAVGMRFIAVALFAILTGGMANADPLSAGSAAYARGDYRNAARIVIPLAERGHARAQALAGFMYATGQGVPQAFDISSHWYRLAAEQGDPTAQYFLGLAYDKGQGLPQDEVAAYKWLNIATARAPKAMREKFARQRDAVASKMSRGQIAAGQWHATRWPAESPF